VHGYYTCGYIPSCNKGIVIGPDYDLGAHSFYEFSKMGTSLFGLVPKFMHYFGRNATAETQNLRAMLIKEPLIISHKQANLLANKIMSSNLQEFQSVYEARKSNRSVSFQSLSRAVKTVFLSWIRSFGEFQKIPITLLEYYYQND